MKQEYKLVRSYDPDGLSQTVSRYLNQGWQIEGNHQIASLGDAPVKRAGEWEERYGTRQVNRSDKSNPQYPIITSYAPLNISSEVTENLGEGWKLYGEMQMEREGGSVCYAQAMTREV